MKFEIGDKVKCIKLFEFNEDIIGLTGIVRAINGNRVYGVEYSREIERGHTCDYNCAPTRGWWTVEECLILTEKKEIKKFGIVKFMEKSI